MASYTQPLRDVIEHFSQYEEGLGYKERIEKGRPHLFDFDYPFFDRNYKPIFETNFIKYFYTREIGFEVEELFKLKLDTWLNLNMGYYNKLFESELIRFNPLHNTDIDTTYSKKNDKDRNDTKNKTQSDSRKSDTTAKTSGTSSGESKTASTGENKQVSFNRDLEASTPQNRLEITANDGGGAIEYADKIEEHKQTNNANTKANGNTSTSDKSDVDSNSNQSDTFNSNVNDSLESNIKTIEDYVQNQTGKTGSQSYSKMIEEYRSTLLRIERTIFREMEELFMGVY